MRRLPRVIRELRVRQGDRPPFRVADERDLEDLLRALLPLHFDDIRPECRTPGYSSVTRTDFLLAPQGIAVTVKLARPRIAEELREDAEYYQREGKCRTLVVLLYDPEATLREPPVLPTANAESGDGLEVRAASSPPRECRSRLYGHDEALACIVSRNSGRTRNPSHDFQDSIDELVMSWLLELRLIRFFGFYLALMLLLSTWVRLRQYGTVLGLVRSMPNRWPRLLQLVKQHAHIFLTWGSVLPLVLLLAIFALNYLASQWLWPPADEFTTARLLPLYPLWPVVFLSGLAMTAFDIWGVVSVTAIDQPEMEKYFDQAEYWLNSWTAPVVRIFTLGRINPRQMVAVEVRTALVSSSRMLNSNLWWIVIQAGLRIAFGLSLWMSYALEPWLNTVLHGR